MGARRSDRESAEALSDSLVLMHFDCGTRILRVITGGAPVPPFTKLHQYRFADLLDTAAKRLLLSAFASLGG